MSGDFKPWKGWGHVREHLSDVSGSAEEAGDQMVAEIDQHDWNGRRSTRVSQLLELKTETRRLHVPGVHWARVVFPLIKQRRRRDSNS